MRLRWKMNLSWSKDSAIDVANIPFLVCAADFYCVFRSILKTGDQSFKVCSGPC